MSRRVKYDRPGQRFLEPSTSPGERSGGGSLPSALGRWGKRNSSDRSERKKGIDLAAPDLARVVTSGSKPIAREISDKTETHSRPELLTRAGGLFRVCPEKGGKNVVKPVTNLGQVQPATLDECHTKLSVIGAKDAQNVAER